MAPVTMKDDALPQIHLVRDTDLGVFAYELHMYRIPLGTAKQLLLDGASVYRLLPGGAEKIAPIAAVRAGLWYEHYREFAVTPENLGALDRLVRRETDRLMRIRPQLDKSQERRPSPER